MTPDLQDDAEDLEDDLMVDEVDDDADTIVEWTIDPLVVRIPGVKPPEDGS